MIVTTCGKNLDDIAFYSRLPLKNYAPINVMPEGGGGPRDRVGTLIRNENLESNFLILGIRFQFKVPHLGEGFEFNISHETENFKPSDDEVKNMCLHLTRLSMIVLLQ